MSNRKTVDDFAEYGEGADELMLSMWNDEKESEFQGHITRLSTRKQNPEGTSHHSF